MRDERADAFGHGAYVVGGGDDRAAAAFELLFDERLVGVLAGQRILLAKRAIACQFAPAGDAENRAFNSELRQLLRGLDDLGQDGPRAH